MRQKTATMPPVRARLRDVAKLAGVSTITVTRALREPHKVTDATRRRVEAIVRRTGYSPDLTARGLALRRSGLVAAIVPLLTNSLIAEIVQGLSDSLSPGGYQLLLGASGFDAAQEEKLVRTFLSRRVDAVYLTGTSHTRSCARLLESAGVPVVEGGNLSRSPIDMAVGYSNMLAAMAVTRYLIERGHRPIGYIGALPKDNDRARDRHRGYQRACAEAGLPCGPEHCVLTSLDLTSGATAMAELLHRHRSLRTVFCSADVLAVGAIFECQRRSIAIPRRMAIAGFDDLEMAAQVVPALTTLRVPRYEIGRRAGEMICERLAGRSVAKPRVDIGFELVPRATA